MFAYCINNPVLYIDHNGNKSKVDKDSYRFVGIGFQFELNIGSYEIGVEIIVYYDEEVCCGKKPLVAVYLYEGAFIGGNDILQSDMCQQIVLKLTTAVTTNVIDEANAKALLGAVQVVLFEEVGVSGSVVGIFGNREFNNTKSYEGAFTTYSATLNHVKVSVATGDICFAITVGGSTEKIGVSFGQSNYTQIM